MTEAVTLDRILELENSEELASIVCPDTGIPAWPAVRNDVLRTIVGDLLFKTAPIVDLAQQAGLMQVGSAAVRSLAWNLTHRPAKSDVLIVATGSDIRRSREGAVNPYTDPFASILGKRGWTRESLFDDRWPGKRANGRLDFAAFDRLHHGLRSRATPPARHRTVGRRVRSVIAERAKTALPEPLDAGFLDRLERVAAGRVAAYGSTSARVRGLLDRVQPSVLLVEEGCYGHRAVLNTIAHQRGIRVAEFQHGLITNGHDAYNVAPAIAANEAYRRSQPDTLLTYGEWWATQVSAPVAVKIPIGNPRRPASPVQRASGQARRILLIGDGIETEAYLAMARRMQAALGPDLAVVFRPHPMERARLTTIDTPVEIDREPDLYASLSRAHAVVAEASTVMFEAIGMAPWVIALDTPKSRFYLGAHAFPRLGAPELLPVVLAGLAVAPSIPAEQIWARGWEDRFRAFLADAAPAREWR